MIYTLFIASTYFLTMLVFVLFTKLVERRQAKVMDRAVRSGAIVSSLFPEQIHDRLYETNNDNNEENPLKGMELTSALARIDKQWQIQQQKAPGQSRWTKLMLPEEKFVHG